MLGEGSQQLNYEPHNVMRAALPPSCLSNRYATTEKGLLAIRRQCFVGKGN
ncbi:hypothetical protein HMPREF9946_00868 [Acetobacteraceae bacterium AT-5844]|nr:hypothetical protein HMPREF9946_00868 [Acetobacteraceae bacterium AT-5844]